MVSESSDGNFTIFFRARNLRKVGHLYRKPHHLAGDGCPERVHFPNPPQRTTCLSDKWQRLCDKDFPAFGAGLHWQAQNEHALSLYRRRTPIQLQLSFIFLPFFVVSVYAFLPLYILTMMKSGMLCNSDDCILPENTNRLIFQHRM